MTLDLTPLRIVSYAGLKRTLLSVCRKNSGDKKKKKKEDANKILGFSIDDESVYIQHLFEEPHPKTKHRVYFALSFLKLSTPF